MINLKSILFTILTIITFIASVVLLPVAIVIIAIVVLFVFYKVVLTIPAEKTVKKKRRILQYY